MTNVKARTQVIGVAVMIVAILALLPIPLSSSSSLTIAETAMAYGIGAIGLDILAGYSGQLSFGQFVYFALGAYVMAALIGQAHVPAVLAIVIAIITCCAMAAVLGSAFVRLPFVGSALGTFFLAAVVADLLAGGFLSNYTHGANGLAVPQASIAGLNLTSGEDGLYYAILIVLALVLAISVRYTKVRSGLAIRVIKRSEIVAAVLGIRVQRERVRAHVIAAGCAGAGGCMLAFVLGYLSPESFGPTESIYLFAMVAVGGLGSISGAIIGAFVYFEATNYLEAITQSAAAISIAVVLLAVLIVFPGGIYGLVELGLARARRLVRSAATPKTAARRAYVERAGATAEASGAPRAIETARPQPAHAGESAPALRISRVSVEFGGLQALRGASLDVLPGQVHAVIGPNGAGKTTLLNCISGIQRDYGGTINVGGSELRELRISRRRELGIGRTFQHPSLVSDLDVLSNVKMGAYARHDGGVIREVLALGRSRHLETEAVRRAREALELIEYPHARWHMSAENITMGEQKRVDMARAMACSPRLLLLDEPTAGLGGEEMETIADAIRAVRRRGVGVLLIAHHVGFIRQCADWVTVLDFGRVIARGTPETVLADPEVVEVFVGAERAKRAGAGTAGEERR